MKNLFKNLVIAFLIFICIAAVFTIFASPFEEVAEITLTELVTQINNEEVKSIMVNGDNLEIEKQDGTKEKSYKEKEASLTESLKNYDVIEEKQKKVNIKIKDTAASDFWLGIFIPFILPFLLIGAFIWFMLKQAQKGSTQAMSFGSSRARLFSPDKKNKLTFKNVAGNEEAKEELYEIVDFLKHPKKFVEIGAKIPKGVLLMGPPGTGKTLMAKAVAGEANVPFFHISGSEFVEMFVGVGASRVRSLFKDAKKNAPCIIFIDELDAVGRHRGAGLGGGHDEREQTLNQILVEMDGFDPRSGVIVLAATNRPDVLDPALLRPGRFDRRVILDQPDINAREAILKIHIKGKPVEKDIILRRLAERTPGFSGADLANLVNESAILAARRGKKSIGMDELVDSIEKVMLGPERKSHILSEKEKEIAAYHEAGHAVTAHLLPNTDPVHKVSIISRGRAAGYTLKLPEKDKHLHSKKEFTSELSVLLGGYVAEKMIFDDITTGASNDLDRTSKLARSLVAEYGMSDELGPQSFSEHDDLVFLGKEFGHQRKYSEKTAEEIDKAVANLIKKAYNKAKETLEKNEAKLKKIAEYLVANETIEKEKFEELMK